MNRNHKSEMIQNKQGINMNKINLLIGFLLFSGYAGANNQHPVNWPERSPVIFWGDRANEDWRYVDQLPDSQKSFSEKLKRIPVDQQGDWHLSLSGNAKFSLDNRWNYNYLRNVRKKNELRTRYHFAGELAWKNLMRIYANIRTDYTNVTRPGPVDNAGTDIHQLFAEFQFINTENQLLSTRLGRQEIYLNDWQIMNREPTPVKSSWNAAVLKYRNDNISLHAYYGEEIFPHYTHGSWTGNWDDKVNGNTSAGLFASVNNKLGMIQGYYMNNRLKNNSFVNAPHGDVKIQVLGLHTHQFVQQGIGYMADSIYQFGDHAGKRISAWMGYLDVNYNWQTDWNYRLGMNMHYASGSSKDSKRVNTFNPLWTGDPLGFATDGAYGNAMQAGIYTVTEYKPKQSIIGGFLSTWRADTDDAIYSLNQDVLFRQNSDKRYAYTQFYLQFHNYWTGNLKTEMNLYYALTSPYLRDVSGKENKNISRAELVVIYNF